MENKSYEDINNQDIEDPVYSYTNEKKAFNSSFLFVAVYLLAFNSLSWIMIALKLPSGLSLSVAALFCTYTMYSYMKRNKLKGVNIFSERKKLSLLQIIPAVGTMYLFALIFGLISNFIVERLPYDTKNVTQLISFNLDLWIAVYAVIIGPIIEEILFRGVILSITRKYGALLSILSSALLFGLFHLNIQQSISTIGLGIVFGYYAYFYSLKVSILLHVINNILAISMTRLGEDFMSFFSYILVVLIILGLIYIFIKFKNIKENLKLSHSDKLHFKSYFKNYGLYLILLILVPLVIIFSFT
ncbi:MAG: CPBP family intramembrane metalloprotease [Tissierellia bacterium]|nr:CPBP family intramembrane metalloprotease [Tissierellia bacterium]